jgi:hypothetical protein
MPSSTASLVRASVATAMRTLVDLVRDGAYRGHKNALVNGADRHRLQGRAAQPKQASRFLIKFWVDEAPLV